MFILLQQKLRKFRKNIYASVVIILLILLFSIIISFHYTAMTYSLSGTYSAANEPDRDNIYIVLKNQEFTIYNQERNLENGRFEKINLDCKPNIYKLISERDTNVGYIIHDKSHIILLDFNGMDFSLKKISTNAIYINNVLE